jgi:septum formation protein
MRAARQLVLASTSPRRRELLEDAGFRFEICAPNVAESRSLQLSARELTLANAIRKARAAARLHSDAVVLACDTVVSLDGAIIGKPSDMEQAREFLQRLNGRTHQVCSAVCVLDRAQSIHRQFTEFTNVTFRKLRPREIDSYLRKIDPLDKAGGYAAQESGSEIIARVDGSFSNVVGLPMEQTTLLLREFGIKSRRQLTPAGSRLGAGAG